MTVEDAQSAQGHGRLLKGLSDLRLMEVRFALQTNIAEPQKVLGDTTAKIEALKEAFKHGATPGT